MRRILVRLHRGLIPILGRGGSGMVLRRGALRAAGRCPAVGKLEIPERDVPTTQSLRRVGAASESDDPAAALATLVAETLSVLAGVVGWTLVLGLLGRHWPAVVVRYTAAELEASPDAS